MPLSLSCPWWTQTSSEGASFFISLTQLRTGEVGTTIKEGILLPCSFSCQKRAQHLGCFPKPDVVSQAAAKRELFQGNTSNYSLLSGIRVKRRWIGQAMAFLLSLWNFQTFPWELLNASSGGFLSAIPSSVSTSVIWVFCGARFIVFFIVLHHGGSVRQAVNPFFWDYAQPVPSLSFTNLSLLFMACIKLLKGNSSPKLASPFKVKPIYPAR